MVEAVEKILAAGSKTGKPIGGLVRADETPRQYKEKGVRLVMTSVRGLVIAGSEQLFDAWALLDSHFHFPIRTGK